MRSKRTSPYREHGFTLLELVVVTAVTGLVTAALGSFFATQYRAGLRERAAIELEEELRVALGFLVRELRVAGFTLDPSRDPSPGDLQGFASPAPTWRNSYSRQDLVTSASESLPEEGRREISLFGQRLHFTRGLDPEILVDGLERATLRYFDSEGRDAVILEYSGATDTSALTFLASGEDLRRVEVTLQAVRAAPGASVHRRLTAAATLRNRP